ncbi:hypothetical protein PCE31106_01513 [Pandoraea cepalis]|uniref:DUF3293 domain-containing protein n=1 Tax=Pandoraea cepalis TaxID=2508294 RepID=A0A5E4TSM3_9BURK|nr:DUF3293 domain-containing protein [Pandoraea cepalis]VVD89039.1 hypothetical protein PCE31106_01513 [Pandoraea cepalis]
MIFSSNINSDTIQAYLETHYCVEGVLPMTLRVGVQNSSLLILHEAAHVESSAFITACNPFSHACEHGANALRQKDLACELTQVGLRFIGGIGQHPSNKWPGEPSFLVLGVSLEAAKDLGERYEQNAIVWAGDDAVPQLVLLR